MIIIFTGDGKGKTTAALGVALRSAGWGRRTAILQFIKGNKKVGEWGAIKNIADIDIFQFVDDHKYYIGKPEIKHKESIPVALHQLKLIVKSKKYDLIILDEINNAIDHKLIDVNQIIEIIRNQPKTDFILTGRNASHKLIKVADLVTEMKKIKHPFDSGLLAKKGIDY